MEAMLSDFLPGPQRRILMEMSYMFYPYGNTPAKSWIGGRFLKGPAEVNDQPTPTSVVIVLGNNLDPMCNCHPDPEFSSSASLVNSPALSCVCRCLNSCYQDECEN
jgi:hypothetical protein